MSALPETVRPRLTLIQGGRNQPEVIAVERREWDETRMELAISRAERVTFVAQVHHHMRSALHALATGQPDADRAEQHVVAAMRLAVRETTRLSSIDDGPEPVAAVAA